MNENVVLAVLSASFAALLWMIIRIINRRERWAIWTLALAGAAVVAVYVGAYLQMVQPLFPDDSVLGGRAVIALARKGSDPRSRIVALQPDYSGVIWYGSEPPGKQQPWERFFAPVHWIDRRIRRHIWYVEISVGHDNLFIVR